MQCVLPRRRVRDRGGRFQARVQGVQRLQEFCRRDLPIVAAAAPDRHGLGCSLAAPAGLGCSLARQRCAGHDAARRRDYRAPPWVPFLSVNKSEEKKRQRQVKTTIRQGQVAPGRVRITYVLCAA